MISIDSIADKTEKLVEKVKNIKFNFKDPDLEKDFDDTKNEIVEMLESLVDLAETDLEQRGDEEVREED